MTVAADEAALAAVAADRMASHIGEAVSTFGSATVCLTGGSTPERLYERLADQDDRWRARIDWPRVHLFWGDERHVPPDHPESNFGMAHRALVAHVPIPPAQVHRMRGELPDAEAAAREYESAMRDGFAAAGRGDLTFDVMLLGLGEDAHIASIFPTSPLLLASTPASPPAARLAAGVWADHLNAWRITLTPGAILDARQLIVLVSGERKASAVHAALEGPPDVSRWPAQLLRGADDRIEWMLDRPAASRLSRVPR